MLSSPETEGPTAAMAPLNSASEMASSDRAVLLSLADLKQLLDSEGRLVVVLKDVESYAEADGYLGPRQGSTQRSAGGGPSGDVRLT